MKIIATDTADLFLPDLAALVAKRCQHAISKKGTFTVAVSGGSLPTILAKALLAPDAPTIDYSKWHLFFADERVVPLDHPESNYRLVQESLLSKFPVDVPSSQVHPLEMKHLHDVQACARDYEERVRRWVDLDANQTPTFDLVLLGMGPDGHTCSLFPGHPDYLRSLQEDQREAVIAVENSPKPPPTRISLTMRVLDAAGSVLFIATGDGKKEVLKRILLDKDSSLPAGRIQNKEVTWFLDRPAAQLLHHQLDL